MIARAEHPNIPNDLRSSMLTRWNFLRRLLPGRFGMSYIVNQEQSTRLLPKIHLTLVKNCQNLPRIPLLRVPTWLVCALVLLHHLTTRTLSFLAAVIYHRISKTSSVLISLKSNKFPCSSFTEMVRLFVDLPWEIYRLFFFLICVVCNPFKWSPFDWVVNWNLWLFTIHIFFLSVN